MPCIYISLLFFYTIKTMSEKLLHLELSYKEYDYKACDLLLFISKNRKLKNDELIDRAKDLYNCTWNTTEDILIELVELYNDYKSRAEYRKSKYDEEMQKRLDE